MRYTIGQRVNVHGVGLGTVVNIRSNYYLTIELDIAPENAMTDRFWIAIPSEVAPVERALHSRDGEGRVIPNGPVTTNQACAGGIQLFE